MYNSSIPETSSSFDALQRSGEGLGRLITLPVKSLVELVSFGDPVGTIKNETRSALTDILMMPFRVAGHVAMGTLKTAGKLTVSAARELPILPVKRQTRSRLDALQRDIAA